MNAAAILILLLSSSGDRIASADVEWNLPAGLAVLSVKTTSRVSIPKDARLVAEWPAPARAGSQSVRLRIDGRAPIFAFVKLGELHPVLVATRALEKGHVLKPGDLATLELPKEGLDLPARALIGRRMQADLHAGDALKERDVELPPPLARGTAVTVIASRGAVRVSVAGQLYQDCRLGERCRALTSIQRQPLFGRLTDDHTFLIAEAQ